MGFEIALIKQKEIDMLRVYYMGANHGPLLKISILEKYWEFKGWTQFQLQNYEKRRNKSYRNHNTETKMKLHH